MIGTAKADRSLLLRQEMVLDGLEDNDDFWNIAPSDDEVPIVDSSQGHLGKDTHGC